MDMHQSNWVEIFSAWSGNIVAIIGLVIALAAFVISREQKNLALASTKSQALLFNSIVSSSNDPEICKLRVSYEARGPIPYYDLRLCVWDKCNRPVQYYETQRAILSSTDGTQTAEVDIPGDLVGDGYFGFVWSEPYRQELITLGKRSPLALNCSSQRTEYWKWTPIAEKLSLGFLAGGWRRSPSNRWMFLSRDIGPTK